MFSQLVTCLVSPHVRNLGLRVLHALLVLAVFGNNIQGLLLTTVPANPQPVYAEEQVGQEVKVTATPTLSLTETEVIKPTVVETETPIPTETLAMATLTPTASATLEATVTELIEPSTTPFELGKQIVPPTNEAQSVIDVKPTSIPDELEPTARVHSLNLASPNNSLINSELSSADLNCYDDGYCVFPVLSNADDGGTLPSSCSNSITDDNVHFGLCNNGATMVSGFRFPGVNLKPGEEIYEAYIEFILDGYYGNQMTLRFDGEATPNATQFSLANPPSSRSLIPNTYSLWDVTEPWVFFTPGRSSDVSNIIQAAINQSGWQSGNALAIITRVTGSVTSGPCGAGPSAPHCNARRVFGWDRNHSGNYPARLVIRLFPPNLPPSQAFAVNECPFCNNGRRVYTLGRGINAYSGNFNYQQNDGQTASVGNTLNFERSFNSLTTGNHISYTLPYSDVLGYGWTHNYNVRLLLNATDELTTTRLLIAPRGSQMRFEDNGDGTYDAFAGVDARLTRSGAEGNYTYLVTTNSQYQYTFDNGGQLLSLRNPHGHITTFTYTAGKLTRITEPSGTRWLELAYNGNGWIQSVSEFANGNPTGRSASYLYTDGNLTSVTDMDGRAWTYVYDTSRHLLEQVKDAAGKLVVRTVFTSAGEAIEQFDELGNRLAKLEFSANNTLQRQLLTTSPADGSVVTTTVTYYEGAVPQSVQDVQGHVTQLGFDFGLNQNQQTNALGETTQSIYADGNLVEAVDAEGARTTLAYDPLNNLTQVTDARGVTTTYTYNESLLISSSDALGNVTLYTYTTAADTPEPANLLREQRDPSGAVTHYTYNELGQPLTVITNYQDGVFDTNAPTEDLKITYTYDALGRVQTTTDPQGHTTQNEYNAAGQVIATTRNYRADLPPYAENFYNLTTAYGYDAVGRVVTTTALVGSPVARTDWTCYDDNGRVIKTVANASGPNACEAGYVPSTDTNYDRISQTQYDSNGNVIATIDATGRVTRTYYDALNRAVQVVENWVWPGHSVEEAIAPAYEAAFPDRNLHSETVYDAVGNVLKTVDNAGQVAYNCYDGNGRVVKTIQNPTVSDPCATYTPSGFTDRDVIQQTVYDANGNAIASIDPAGRITRTYYDELNRPEYTVINLVEWDVQVATPPAFNSAFPSQNLVTRTYYDDAGRTYRTEDLTQSPSRNDWTCFDDLGRVIKTVQNAISFATVNPCLASYPISAQTDNDIVTELVYDADGQQIAVVASDGSVTRTYFDENGQRIAQVQNLVGQPISSNTPPAFNPTWPNQNLLTRWGYDILGRVVTTTVAAGSVQARTDWTCYDVLGRVIKTITNASGTNPCEAGYIPSGRVDEDLITQTIYDGAGNAIATIDPAGRITRTYYDGLSRPIMTVANLMGVAIAESTPPAYNPAFPDQNVRQVSVYDAAGRVSQTIDNAGMVSQTSYDRLGRVLTTTVNVSSTPSADITNLMTLTSYDRLGNALSRTDAEGIVTLYEYDSLNRLQAVVENYRPGFVPSAEVNVRTEYTYDAHGNRLAIRNGNATLNNQNTHTAFAYDALGRQIRETDPVSNTFTYGYNKLGQRVVMTDALSQITTYTFDALGRLTLTDYVAGTADVLLAYDVLGNRLVMTDGTGVTTWIYDELSRPLTITSPISGAVGYRYDVMGNRTELVYPDGRRTVYGYDGLNRLVSVTPMAGPAEWAAGTTTYTYNAAGQIISTVLPNGVTTLNTYDSAQRLIKIEHQTITQTLAAYAYILDAMGNRVQVVESQLQPPTEPLTSPLRVSVMGPINLQANAPSTMPDISDDGRVVVFQSAASNLVADDTNNQPDIFVRYLDTGVTRRVSVSASGAQAEDWNDHPVISGDGRYVAFRSAANGLTSPDGPFEDVFRYDTHTRELRLVNGTTTQAGNCNSDNPAISSNGRYIAFDSCADNLPLGNNGSRQVFLRDMVNNTVLLVSHFAGTPAFGNSVQPALSDDGRYVAFTSAVSNFVEGDTNDALDIFVYDRDTAVITRLSHSLENGPANGHSEQVALSADGRYAVFRSWANNLVRGDTNGTSDIFFYDRDTDADGIFDETGAVRTQLISLAADGLPADGPSDSPVISADGRFITFRTEASNVVTGDVNGVADVVIVDRLTGRVAQLSQSARGEAANAISELPTLTANGQVTVFTSEANNLVISDTNLAGDVFRVTTPNFLNPPMANTGTGTGLLGLYYNYTTPDAGFAFTRTDAQVNFDWGFESADPALPADDFAVRWLGEVEAPYSGVYTFTTFASDGVRLWVNDQLLIDDWTGHNSEWRLSTPITLVAGTRYNIKLEYVEYGGEAAVQLYWQNEWWPRQLIPQTALYPASVPTPLVGTGTGLLGLYFANATFAGGPAFWQTNAPIEFNWADSSPGGLPTDDFSVRWNGEVQAQFTDAYQFHTYSDDGVRVWVNGQLVIDDAGPHSPTWAISAPITLIAGVKYPVTVEFAETMGDAVVELHWSSEWTVRQLVPASQLYPAAIPTPTPTPTNTPTNTPTATPTNTPTPTLTNTPTATQTNTPTRTFTPSNTPTRTNTPTNTATNQPDLIFADSFEGGNTNAWTTVSNPGGSLTVVSGAALSGALGLRANVNTNTAMYVQNDSPNAEKRYRARFYFDPNTITMASANAHYIFMGYSGTSTAVVRVEFQKNASNAYQLRLNVINDSTAWSNTAWVTITDAPHRIELDWKASTAAGANNGYVSWWLDGTAQTGITAFDNDTRKIDMVRLGLVSGRDSGTTGPYFFDHFESRRSTLIGAVAPTGGSKVLAKRLAAQPARPQASIGLTLSVITTTYTYDPLYRLTYAAYSNGHFFEYEYDAVGNTITKTSASGVVVNNYDVANRLYQSGATAYAYDANGNLLNNGTSTYTYDAVNRLMGVSGPSTVTSYQYNGQGDRVSQTINSVTTNYVLDLNAGLTQVLSDGSNTYLYGAVRIGEQQTASFVYHLGDALGSVRELVNTNAHISLTQSYEPYGSVLSSAGNGTSAYAFTGEQYDSVTGLVYLRARYYAPGAGRFMTRDTWVGDDGRPMSYNKWAYVEGNPLNRVDPTGYCAGFKGMEAGWNWGMAMTPLGWNPNHVQSTFSSILEAWKTCQQSLSDAINAFQAGEYRNAFLHVSGTTAGLIQAQEGVATHTRNAQILTWHRDPATGKPINLVSFEYLQAYAETGLPIVFTIDALGGLTKALGACAEKAIGNAVMRNIKNIGVFDDMLSSQWATSDILVMPKVGNGIRVNNYGVRVLGDPLDKTVKNWSYLVEGEPRYYNINTHGNIDGTKIQFGENWIDAKQTASLISSDPGYMPNTPINLITCYSGKCPNGFAQQLATQMNTIVRAATGRVLGNGITLDMSDISNMWKIFKP